MNQKIFTKEKYGSGLSSSISLHATHTQRGQKLFEIAFYQIIIEFQIQICFRLFTVVCNKLIETQNEHLIIACQNLIGL